MPTNDKSPQQRLNDEYNDLRLELAESTLLPAANRGEFWAIRNLLSILADALADGSQVSAPHAIYLAEALRSIADGKDHKAAFGIRRKRGEKDTRDAKANAFVTAYRVEYLRWQGHTLEESVAKVSADTMATENTVKWCWKKNHEDAKREIQMQLNTWGKVTGI